MPSKSTGEKAEFENGAERGRRAKGATKSDEEGEGAQAAPSERPAKAAKSAGSKTAKSSDKAARPAGKAAKKTAKKTASKAKRSPASTSPDEAEGPAKEPARPPASSSGFARLGLTEKTLPALRDMGFENPTPIQEKSIPVGLSGEDLIGQARTGTGKTAAFGLPMLEKIDPESKALQALILCPTRELAAQVSSEMERMAKHIDVGVLPCMVGRTWRARCVR